MSSRGKNFTEREKCNLLEIINKYKHIIENKSSNAVSVLKKNEVWTSITAEFNCTSEIPRSQKQLNTAYLNLKRSTRQNVAKENVQKYLEAKQLSIDSEAGPSQTQTLSLTHESITHNKEEEMRQIIKQFKKDEIADKKGVMATGGGVYMPVLTNVGAQMLAVMKDQIQPLANSCDSASSYFNNNKPVTLSDSIITSQEISLPTELSDYETNRTKKNLTSTSHPRSKNKTKQQKTNRNNDFLKNKYYEHKLQCVLLERRTKIIEHKVALKKQKFIDVEIKIKEKEYENFLKE